jgi:hypothetical protein
MPEIVVVERGSCGDGGELTDARSECREDGRGGDASGFGKVVAVGASDL